MNSLYEKMKAAGLDLSWYEKAKRQNYSKDDKGTTPLSSEACSLLSIYLMDEAGKLWTTTPEGKPYMVARYTSNRPEKKLYLCVACNHQFKTYKAATKHYKKDQKQ